MSKKSKSKQVSDKKETFSFISAIKPRMFGDSEPWDLQKPKNELSCGTQMNTQIPLQKQFSINSL
jgi:hypothetical protein